MWALDSVLRILIAIQYLQPLCWGTKVSLGLMGWCKTVANNGEILAIYIESFPSADFEYNVPCHLTSYSLCKKVYLGFTFALTPNTARDNICTYSWPQMRTFCDTNWPHIYSASRFLCVPVSIFPPYLTCTSLQQNPFYILASPTLILFCGTASINQPHCIPRPSTASI